MVLALRSEAVTVQACRGHPQREEPEARSEIEDSGADDQRGGVLVHRSERRGAVLEANQGVAIEPQPGRVVALDGRADHPGEDRLELGLATQDARVVEFDGQQFGEVVADLVGPQVVCHVQNVAAPGRAEPVGAQRVQPAVGDVRPAAAPHAHGGVDHAHDAIGSDSAAPEPIGPDA